MTYRFVSLYDCLNSGLAFSVDELLSLKLLTLIT